MFGRKAPGVLLRLLALGLTGWLLGTSLALAAPEVPPLLPDPIQDISSTPLTEAEREELDATLASLRGPVRYKILIIDSSKPQGLEEYLEAVWSEWRLPNDTVLLVVARQDGNAIRFYLGGEAGRHGITVDSALAAIRQHYAPAVREGGLAAGLKALVAELHRQATGEAPVPDEPEAAADPGPGDWRRWLRWPLPSLPRLELPDWQLPDFQLPDWKLPDWQLPPSLVPPLPLPRVNLLDPRLPLWLGAGGLGCIGYSLLRYALALRRWQQGP
ncbi:MAG: TPM domain-containing protein [Firmicutes bacterium]|nr:TPM domain-containing protein [Bacillota bacterium]